MRLWHKDLVRVLPRQQLLGQWRECCAIAKNIADNGTPNHILVNKVMDYPLSHLDIYSVVVYDEMKKRGYRPDIGRFTTNYDKCSGICDEKWVAFEDIYPDWHNERYLTQCYYNLQEKYDCGGITEEEWEKIEEVVSDEMRCEP